MRLINLLAGFLCLGSLIPAVVSAEDSRLTVFAAASLRDVLSEAAQHYAEEGQIVLSYAGSGLIARQVAQGAPADLVLLANEAWMGWLEQNGPSLSLVGDVISNRLVLVAPKGSDPVLPAQVVDRLGPEGRLATGNTLGVPAGIYGRQWMERSGLWPDLAPRLAETDNVRAALALVARGEAPLGVVYRSDALADPGVDIVYEIPADRHDPIRYQLAVMSDDASGFADFLLSEAGQSLFIAHGFTALETKD